MCTGGHSLVYRGCAFTVEQFPTSRMIFFLIKNIFIFMCVYALSGLYLVPAEPVEGIGSQNAGVKGSYQLSCRCWEPNLSPLKEQLVL